MNVIKRGADNKGDCCLSLLMARSPAGMQGNEPEDPLVFFCFFFSQVSDMKGLAVYSASGQS